MQIPELFDQCFELSEEHRITASKIAEIMKLAGCACADKHVYMWLDKKFRAHEFVRKVRPGNVRTWIGIKPRFQLVQCSHCGAMRYSHKKRRLFSKK